VFVVVVVVVIISFYVRVTEREILKVSCNGYLCPSDQLEVRF